MSDGLYHAATEIFIRVKILRTNFRIDKESAEIAASLAELIRLELRSNSPDYREISELAAAINRTLTEATTSPNADIFS